MKRSLLFTGILLSFLFSCKNPGNRITRTGDIDIEHALQNPARLKASDFGNTIRYIPLETTDAGLIGSDPVLKVLKNYIVVESQRSCLLFNKNDGSFIAEIGHIGQGPADYSDIYSWTDEKEEFLYFKRRPDQLIKYNMKGEFCGKVEFPTPPGLASYYLISDSDIIGYFNNVFGQTNPFVLGIFDKEGVLKDTVPQLIPDFRITPDEIVSVNIFKRKSSYDLYGNLASAGVILFDFKNDTKHVIFPNAARVWEKNGIIRFKEDFVDTLYTYSDKKLIPSIVFNTGKYHWPVQERTNTKNTDERIFIADVSENETFVFFQCIKGMLSDKSILYHGLYDKQTGETKLGKSTDLIEDDLTHFMPFIPLGMSTTGEFVSLVEVGDIMKWLEEHPEAKNNENLTFLKTLDEEMNPVVILIE
jgi:hypothetical protein